MQDAIEFELGLMDDAYDNGGSSCCQASKIEPFFLYEENTGKKHRKEKDSLRKALRKILNGGIGGSSARGVGGGEGSSNATNENNNNNNNNKGGSGRDNAETLSNELLLMELFAVKEGAGGEITKD